MTAPSPPPSVATARELPRGHDVGWWGMALLVTTEATLFASLLAGYFYVRFTQAGPWPPDGVRDPALLRPGIMTAVLVTSSATIIWVDRSMRRGRVRSAGLALALTAALGVAFLTMQATEYADKLREATWSADAYHGFFYVITGFHGFHVAIGVVMVIWLVLAAGGGAFSAARHERVRHVSTYWHFVDVVWLVVLFSLYISPRLGS